MMRKFSFSQKMVIFFPLMMKNFRKQRRLMFSNHYTLRSFLLVSFFLPGACPQPLLCEPNHGRSPAGVIQHNFANDGLQPDPRRDWRASLSTCTPNLSQTCALPPLVTSESGVIFFVINHLTPWNPWHCLPSGVPLCPDQVSRSLFASHFTVPQRGQLCVSGCVLS